MALNVGELEATLKLRDELSAKLGDANKKVADFGKQLQQTTSSGSSGMGDLSSMALKVGAAVGIGFSIQQVIAFGKAVLDDADNLVKLHDKTGISFQGLQQMRVAGDDASVSLDSMTQAVNMMQKRLAGGDASAEAALKKVNINIDELLAMEPQKMYFAISDAVRSIKDPAEQVALATAVMGRAGAEQLPVLKRGFDDVKNATVGMSDTSIKKLDDLGDTITRWSRATKGAIGEALGIMLQGGQLKAGANAFVADLQRMTDTATKAAPKFKAMLPPGLPADLEKINAGFDKDAEAIKKASTEVQKHGDALEAVNKKIQEATRDIGHLTTTQENAILTYKALGLSNTDIALKLGVSEIAVGKFDEALTEQISKMSTATIKTGEWQASIKGLSAVLPKASFDLESFSTSTKINDRQLRELIVAGDGTKEALFRMGDAMQTMPGHAAVMDDALKEAHDRLDTVKKKTDDYGESLSILSDLFTKLGQISGGSGLGSFMTGMGQSVVKLEAAHKWTTQLSADYTGLGESGHELGGKFGPLSTMFNEHASKTQKMGAAAASAAAIYEGANAVWDATASHATAAGNALGGMAAGAQAGASFGPWGMAIGAAAGLVVGIIRGKPDWAKAADEVANDFGTKISNDLAKSIAEHAKDFGSGSMQASAISSLSAIIKEAGGLTEKNLTQMTSRLHDAFSMIETNQMTVAQGTKVLDENFGAFAQASTNNLGLLNKSMVDIIALNDRFGTQSKAVSDYIAGQMTNAQTGFAAALKVTGDAYTTLAGLQSQAMTATGEGLEKLNAQMLVQQGIIDATGLHSQDAAAAVAGSLVGIVASNMKAGQSFIQAVVGIGPSVDALQKQLEATGYSGGAAFDFIKQEVALANDAIAGPALTAVEGYTAGMVGLSNAGVLNQDTFAGLAGQIAGTEAALEKQGYSGSAVMLAMKGDLQTVWELQQRYGYKVDESTQAMIDQGVESGLIGEQGKSDNQKILDVLMAIGEALGATIPAGLKDMGAAAAATSSQVVADLVTVTDTVGGMTDYIHAGQGAWSDWSEAAQVAADAAQGSLDSITVPTLPDLNVHVNVPSINVPDVNVNVNGHWNLDQPPDWGGGQASGGDYLVTRPTLFLAGEVPGSSERVSFSGATKAQMNSGGSSPVMERRLANIERLLRDQPRAMAVAVSDAVLLAGRA